MAEQLFSKLAIEKMAASVIYFFIAVYLRFLARAAIVLRIVRRKSLYRALVQFYKDTVPGNIDDFALAFGSDQAPAF